MVNETFAFQAEINQLLSLIINTFYSNKDVFLRELISNASDALDKLRYKQLTEQNAKQELSIKLFTDKNSKTISIQDFGIGMSKDELIRNLGTIAHSGTKAFMESIENGTADMSLIGQFGVGFYSAFLVADKVKVVSKSANSPEEVWVWESNASGTFTINEHDNNDVDIGTTITLYLKEDQQQYLEESTLTEIITKHSQYIGFPIYLHVEREEVVEEDKEAEDVENEEGNIEDVPTENTDKQEDKEKKTKIVHKWEHLNKQQPLWTRKSDDVTHDEYVTFYKSLSADWEEHMAVKHFCAEGQIEFKALLYIPSRAPFDMFNGGITKKMNNIKLYVRKVLIMDESNDILPEYLSFVKGIVDSDDLPLNVSREMLQQNNIMKLIKKNLVKKVIDMMVELSENDEKYKIFYQNFSKNIKLGIMEDSKSKEKLYQLLRYTSLNTDNDNTISLDSYVENMKEGQKDIYYITGESVKVMKNMPCLEKLKKKGYDVILMSDAIDEYMMQHIREYKDKKFVNCSKDDFVLEDEMNELVEIKKEWEPFCKEVKEILGNLVKEVRVSDKLVSRPCVIVSDKYGWSANMERIMKAQALKSNEHFMFGNSQKYMEINVEHDIIKNIRNKFDMKQPIKDAINILYDVVLLDSGYQLEEPGVFCSKIYRLINMGLSGIDEDEINNDNISDEHEKDIEKETSIMEEVD